MGDCYKCGKEIYFDDNVRSSNDKAIPLDVGGLPHDCEDIDPITGFDNTYKRQCYRCNGDIFFDDNYISRSGKCIPLDWESGDPHQC